jgi:ribose transport system substrate-binding protein
LSSDHKEIGRIQGRQFAALLPKGGTVLYIQGPSETSAAQDRSAGMQMTISHSVQIVSLRGRWTEESAQKAVESWLRLNTSNKTQIDVVGAQNDLMAMGARKAFEHVSNIADREKWLRLPFTGVDGLAKTGMAWVRNGTLAATVMVPTNTGQAISMLVEALQTGRDVPERSYTSPESFPAIEKLAPKSERLLPTV